MKSRFFAFALFGALSFSSSYAQVAVSVQFAPPPLVVEEQTPCPVDGYLWTPGYWGYSDVGYYWAPGYWAQPPEVGLLWTPPWWGFNNGVYAFNDGYWGPQVGFYGGINYGFGYFGDGYYGGRWDGNVFRYNTAVTRVNTSLVHNVFEDRSVLSKQVNTNNRASFNGPNGVQAQPTAEQKAAENARHVPATPQQTARREAASKNPELQASLNKGHPKPEAIRSFDKNAQAARGAEGRQAGGQAGRNAGLAGEKAEAAPGANTTPRETQRREAASRENGENARNAEGRESRENAEARGNGQNAEDRELDTHEKGRNEENRASEAPEGAQNAQPRGMEARPGRPGEISNAAARREMTERSRRPENAAPRQQPLGNAAAERHGQPEPRKKAANPQASPGDQH